MLNEKILKPVIFIIVAVLHAIIILFLVFKVSAEVPRTPENARVMKLTDIAEIIPDPEIPQVEEIAEVMIETDVAPVQNVVAAGSLSFDNYLQMHQVSVPPRFDEKAFISALIYPPIAQRSGIGGKVLLELFVDRTGVVQKVTILREEPKDKGFGEAAVKAFMSMKGTPAYANGEAVSCHFRYPVTFTIK
jgi:protein TonB